MVRDVERIPSPDGTPHPLPLSPDQQDALVGASGENSIFQRIRHLTPQQREVVDGLLSGLSAAEACARAGYKSQSAMKAIKSKIPDIMERAGLNEEILVTKYLTPLLEAHETRFFQKDGIVCDTRTVEDNTTRRQALDMAFKLTGAYSQDDEDQDARDITVNILSIGGGA